MGGGATVVRQARRDRRDPDKGIEAPRCSRTVGGARVTRQENPDVKSKVKAARRVQRRLLSEFGKLIAMLVLAFCFKGNNQNKHLFAPPPRRFLNYRVGPRGTAHARQSTAPPLARKYVGKNLRCRHNNCEHQPIEAAAWVLADAQGPVRGERSPFPCPPSQISVKVGNLVPWPFRRCRPALDLYTRESDCRLVYCDRIVWSALYTTVSKAPPSQAPYLAAVSQTDRKISTLPERSNPLKRQFRPHPPVNPHQWRGGRPLHPGN